MARASVGEGKVNVASEKSPFTVAGHAGGIGDCDAARRKRWTTRSRYFGCD